MFILYFVIVLKGVVKIDAPLQGKTGGSGSCVLDKINDNPLLFDKLAL